MVLERHRLDACRLRQHQHRSHRLNYGTVAALGELLFPYEPGRCRTLRHRRLRTPRPGATPTRAVWRSCSAPRRARPTIPPVPLLSAPAEGLWVARPRLLSDGHTEAIAEPVPSDGKGLPELRSGLGPSSAHTRQVASDLLSGIDRCLRHPTRIAAIATTYLCVATAPTRHALRKWSCTATSTASISASNGEVSFQVQSPGPGPKQSNDQFKLHRRLQKVRSGTRWCCRTVCTSPPVPSHRRVPRSSRSPTAPRVALRGATSVRPHNHPT